MESTGQTVRRRRLFRLRSREGEARPKRFSTVLRLLGEESDGHLTVHSLAETFGDRAFGALMFVFAVPNLLPLPPGSSAVFGLPLMVIAVQLAIGRPYLWLPGVLGRQSIRRSDLKAVLDRALPVLRRAERLLSPRLVFLFGPVGDRAIGIICLVLAAVLFLPLPFVNLVPALAIALFALALLQRDGVFFLLALLVAAATGVLLVLVSGALWVAAKAFFATLAHTFG